MPLLLVRALLLLFLAGATGGGDDLAQCFFATGSGDLKGGDREWHLFRLKTLQGHGHHPSVDSIFCRRRTFFDSALTLVELKSRPLRRRRPNCLPKRSHLLDPLVFHPILKQTR